MTVNELREKLGLKALNLSDPTRDVRGGFCGDLLSWVMGRASDADAWITIMTNKNIVAVASLADVPCVIICENCETDEDLIGLAAEKGINLFLCPDSEFSVAGKLYGLLEKER